MIKFQHLVSNANALYDKLVYQNIQTLQSRSVLWQDVIDLQLRTPLAPVSGVNPQKKDFYEYLVRSL